MPDLDTNVSLDDVMRANALCDMYDHIEAQANKKVGS